MKVLIVVGGRRLLQDPLIDAVELARAAGGRVSTITWFPVGPQLAAATTMQVELRSIDLLRRAEPPRLGVTRIDRRLTSLHRKAARPRAGLRRRWDQVLRKAKWDPQAALVHRLVSTDARCRAMAGEADIIVAGDVASIRTVWLLARRRPEVVAINGLAAFATFLSVQRSATTSLSGRGSRREPAPTPGRRAGPGRRKALAQPRRERSHDR